MIMFLPKAPVFFSLEFWDKKVRPGKHHVTHRSKTKLTKTTTCAGLFRCSCAQMLLPNSCLRVKKPLPTLSLVFPISSVRHSNVSPRIAKPNNVKKKKTDEIGS